MRLSKFIVCFLLFFLHTTAPHLVQATESFFDIELRQIKARGGDNGTDESDFQYLVTGGYRPPKNDLVKYAVSVRLGEPKHYFGSNHICGGSIISKRAILTAGHCMFSRRGIMLNARNVKVFAGTPRRLEEAGTTQEIRARRLIPHPKYRPGRHRNDLGIIKLKGRVRLNEYVAIIPLNNRRVEPGLACTVIGWGTVVQYGPSADEAINGDVQIFPNSECQKLASFNPKGMICARNTDDTEVDSCQGDSGGPLISSDDVKLVGVVSYGDGCGEKHSAGVYTDVYHYRKWIRINSAKRLLVSRVSLSLWLLLLFLPAWWR